MMLDTWQNKTAQVVLRLIVWQSSHCWVLK